MRVMSPADDDVDITVSVDPECCQGAQRCLYLAPDAVVLDDDGLLARPVDPVPMTDPQAVIRVASGCPTSAIVVYLASKPVYP